MAAELSAKTAVGWCEREIERELPQLRLALCSVHLAPRVAPTRPAPQTVRDRLASLSNRFGGARAINLRREPVPAAYRVFYRHIGLDPDVVRTPIEAVVLERMLDGAFLTRNLLSDVLLIGLLDTGVPVWALDADKVHGTPGIRMSRAGEAIEDGRLVVADSQGPLSLLFAEPAASRRPCASSRRLLLYALQVGGVPWLTIEEALWICGSALEALV
jgi:DNA/RNA-binding domain of Phe-tRNA-synthetase-like protein